MKTQYEVSGRRRFWFFLVFPLIAILLTVPGMIDGSYVAWISAVVFVGLALYLVLASRAIRLEVDAEAIHVRTARFGTWPGAPRNLPLEEIELITETERNPGFLVTWVVAPPGKGRSVVIERKLGDKLPNSKYLLFQLENQAQFIAQLRGLGVRVEASSVS